MAADGDRPPRRILVVDDQRAFAQSLEVVLEADESVEWVDNVPTGESAIEFVKEHSPNVVVMDIELPGMNGVDAIRQIADLDPSITNVVLTGIPDAAVFVRAASAGAHAFLLKDSSLEEILDAVLHTTPREPLHVDASSVREIVEASNGAGAEIADQLTPRELEVLGMLAEGRQPKEIARSLGISLHTCRDHVKSLLAKLDAHSALEAVIVAIRYGIIALPSD